MNQVPLSRFFAALLLLGVTTPLLAQSHWRGGSGDWFDPNKWYGDIPHSVASAAISRGEVTFNTPAVARSVIIDGQAYEGTNGPAVVHGFADLNAGFQLVVGGTANQSNQGVYSTDGTLNMAGGDIFMSYLPASQWNPFPWPAELSVGHVDGSINGVGYRARGVLDLEDGSIEGVGNIKIGVTEGSGKGAISETKGEAQINGGSIRASESLWVGVAVNRSPGLGANIDSMRFAEGRLSVQAGNLFVPGFVTIGSAVAEGRNVNEASGELVVTGGGIDVPVRTPDPSMPQYSYSEFQVGTATAADRGRSDARGLTEINAGHLFAQQVSVGVASSDDQSVANAEGTLRLVGSVMVMDTLTIGHANGAMATAQGVLEQHRGVTVGERLDLGVGGRIVLGVEGTTVGAEYAAIRVQEASATGVIEALFATTYAPQFGDEFVLIEADSLTGDYDVLLTGLTLPTGLRMEVTASATQLRLNVVPEPNALIVASLGAVFGWVVRRR